MYTQLDDIQKEIVTSNAKNILVIAGSGSGKTRVLTERIKYLLDTQENIEDIVAITFTNAAADEIKERIGEQANNIYIGTIHGYANQLLLRAGVDTSKLINDEQFDELFEEIQDHPEAIKHISHLLVDEFQDIDSDQYFFLFGMLQPDNFFVVGDDNQCIYSFRGSDVTYFFDLYNDPLVTVYKMENNYRTGYNILSFATKFLRNLQRKIPKKVYPKVDYEGTIKKIHDGGIVSRDFTPIVKEIEEKKDYGKWFILTRTNSQLDKIKNFLEEKNIPCDTFKRGDLTTSDFNNKMKENTVKVLTAHSAKGLENDHVVVYGVIPRNDEEKRLAYVAATRAKKELIWIYTDHFSKKKRTEKVYNWE